MGSGHTHTHNRTPTRGRSHREERHKTTKKVTLQTHGNRTTQVEQRGTRRQGEGGWSRRWGIGSGADGQRGGQPLDSDWEQRRGGLAQSLEHEGGREAPLQAAKQTSHRQRAVCRLLSLSLSLSLSFSLSLPRWLIFHYSLSFPFCGSFCRVCVTLCRCVFPVWFVNCSCCVEKCSAKHANTRSHIEQSSRCRALSVSRAAGLCIAVLLFSPLILSRAS